MCALAILAILVDACVLPTLPSSSRPPATTGNRPARPGPARISQPPYPTVQSLVLPSGLLVLIEHDPYAKAAGEVSVVAGGASADPQGAEGLAHLVEHLTFRAVDATPEKPLPLSATKKAGPASATRRERLVHHAAALTNGLTSPAVRQALQRAWPGMN